MNTVKTLLVCLCITLALSKSSDAKEWRGITPMRSTLADVVRQFGPCTAATKNSCTYVWVKETVTIVFLSKPCGTSKQRLPSGTVVRIERRPNTSTSLPDYHKIEFNHYLAFRLPESTQEYLENYIDDAEGFAAEARQHLVTQVHYTARSEESSLCPGSYVKPSDLLPRYKDVIVWEFFCPTIVVNCQDKTVEVDEQITFSASWSGGFPYMEPSYKWTVSAGTIVAGQGTPTIRVNTKGLPDDTELTASFTLGGSPVECTRKASCTTKIHPYRVRVRDQKR